MTRFGGQTAIVTGGASGIGRATVELLAREDARVVVADLPDGDGEGVARACGGRFVATDVSDRAAVEALVREAGDELAILVNNAGIGSVGETPDLDPEEWRRVFAIDLDAVFWACRAAVPVMRARGGGAIVNVASISGLFGDYGFCAYNAAKGGLINYTRALAIDHAKDAIRANAVCPGLVETPLTDSLQQIPGMMDDWLRTIPMGRMIAPAEIAQAIAFLASDAASAMTGAAMVVDAGMTASTGQPNFIRRMKETGAELEI